MLKKKNNEGIIQSKYSLHISNMCPLYIPTQHTSLVEEAGLVD